MYKVFIVIFIISIIFTSIFTVNIYAESVAEVIENTWNDAEEQVKQVVNNVVFPAVDLVIAVMFFFKIGTAYFEYKKHGQVELTAPIILFICLIITLTAPLYIWSII